MPRWKVKYEEQCHDATGEVFVCVLSRIGREENTDTLPRRVVGTGVARALARSAALEAMRAYDSMGVLLAPR